MVHNFVLKIFVLTVLLIPHLQLIFIVPYTLSYLFDEPLQIVISVIPKCNLELCEYNQILQC